MAAWSKRQPGDSYAQALWAVILGSLIPVGYALSLGPALHWAGSEFHLPMLYAALLKFPIFNLLNIPFFFFLPALVGINAAAAYALERLVSAWPFQSHRLMTAFLCAFLLIDTLPYPYVLRDGSSRLLVHKSTPHGNPDLVTWLNNLEPGTALYHYPNTIGDLAYYMPDQWQHDQPMVNGFGALTPPT
jgi:hypothetical protein